MDLILEYFADAEWENVILTGTRIFLIVVIAWIMTIFVKVSLFRLETKLIREGEAEGEVPSEAAKRAETLVRLLRQGVFIVLWIVVGLVALREIGVEIGPILASAGIFGLAVGFGAQNLVRDIISGFFLILENQIRLGDVAVVNGTGGLVEKINFRTIVLRDLEGVVHVFPNGTVTTLSNRTQEWSAYILNIGVAYKENVDRVMDIMRDVASEMRRDNQFGSLMIEEIEILGVDDFADSAVVIKARLKTKPIKQWEVGREYRRRLKHAFDQSNIEIPFPHRTFYFGDASKPIRTQILTNG